ncbi:MAG: HD-GYP domain-containing protein [Calditrichaceae bacterium]
MDDNYILASEAGRPKILIVDDSAENIEIIEHILEDLNYDISEAFNGTEALEKINKINPDLILLDVVMPGMSGFEVAKHIKSRPDTRLIPIIMVTALDGQQDRLKGLNAGVDDFITKPVNIFELRARINNLLRLRDYISELEHAEQVIFSLARTVEAKDRYTEGHCERLSTLAEKLGSKLGLSEQDLTILRRGGILHDIGKIAISDAILLKPGPLTSGEYDIIKQHPEIGERICAPLKTLRPVLPTIRYHQERFNGSGYPDGLAGHDIPIHARIIGIVDCYDALTTKRTYRGALSHNEAFRIMRDETRHGLWDPEIMNVFDNMMHS